MDIMKLSIVVAVSSILSVILKKYSPEYSLVISLLAGIFIFFSVLSKIQPAIDRIRDLIAVSQIPSHYLFTLFKAIGICFLIQFASDSCKDAGENALASKLELSGKIAIILVALPLFEDVIEIVLKLISK